MKDGQPLFAGTRVRDLIAQSTWEPGRDQLAERVPVISVLLPTFRRAADGRYERAVRSILDQTFSDLELIIVDDASTDGTADITRRLMSEDGRISCIWHAHNIGLPAISEYEAFVRSRGQYIAFLFDDFEFRPDALERLLAAARAYPQCVVHGRADLLIGPAKKLTLEKGRKRHIDLFQDNFLANSSFLIPRTVLELVGLYCPHILASRLCDWNLWLRIHRNHFLKQIDVDVGTEHGVVLKDSLGNTHPLNYNSVTEFLRDIDDRSLTPSEFPDYDVWSLPGSCSAHLAAAIINTRKFYKSKKWAELLPVETPDAARKLNSPSRTILGLVGHLDASFSIFFSAFADRHGGAVKFIHPAINSLELLRGCDAVLLIRGLLDQHFQQMIAAATSIGIDRYYFTDDNFMVLAEEGHVHSGFSQRRVRGALAGFKGVFVGSEPLNRYFVDHRLHDNVRTLTPAWDADVRRRLLGIERQTSGALHIAFVGGSFRARALLETVLPAIRKLSLSRKVKLFVRGEIPIDPPGTIEVIHVDETSSYEDFLATWRQFGIDVLVHPRGATMNARYKNNHILLTAWYLGAVPVVDDEDAFRHIGDDHGVKKASDIQGWYAAIESAVGPACKADFAERLDRAVKQLFDPTQNHEVLSAVLSETKPRDIASIGGAPTSPPPAPKRSLPEKILREFWRAHRRYLGSA